MVITNLSLRPRQSDKEANENEILESLFVNHGIDFPPRLAFFGYYTLHNNESFARTFNLSRRNVKQFRGTSWLLIFHHDSIGGTYFTRDNCKYNIDPQLYSIIDDENLYSQSYKKSGFYYFLLEYPEVPSYQIFTQKEFITPSLSNVGYKKEFGDDWYAFNGLAQSLHYDQSYIDGTPGDANNQGFNFIGAWSGSFNPRIPTLFCKYSLDMNLLIFASLLV